MLLMVVSELTLKKNLKRGNYGLRWGGSVHCIPGIQVQFRLAFFLVWVVSAMLELVFVSVCVLSLGGCEQ